MISLLHLDGEVVPDLVGRVRAVEQERGATLGPVQHRHLLEEAELVAGDEVGVARRDTWSGSVAGRSAGATP